MARGAKGCKFVAEEFEARSVAIWLECDADVLVVEGVEERVQKRGG